MKHTVVFLKFFALACVFCGFFLVRDVSAAQKLDSKTYLTLDAYGVQSMTITPSYWAFVRGHDGSILLYSRSAKKQVYSTDIKSQCDGDDITYYPKNKELIVYPGCRYKADGSLKYIGMTKIHSSSGHGVISYAKDGGFFVSGSRSKVNVYTDIIGDGKKTATYETHGEPNGSLVYKGVLYRVSNSAVLAYDLDKNGKLLGEWTTDANNHCQDMDVDESGNVYILCLGGKSEVRKINGPESIVKLFKRNYNSVTDGGGSSGGNNGSSEKTEPKVQVAPAHEEQCATILEAFCKNAETDGQRTITDIIKFIVSIMTVGVVVLATVGIIICGYLIMTARGNTEQITKAKKRILEIVIGVAIWVLISVLTALLLPTTDSNVEEVVNKATSSSFSVLQ